MKYINSFKRLLVLSLALLLLLSALVGCQQNGASGTDGSEEQGFSLTKDNLALYSIVIPDKADDTTESVASQLSKKIKSITGSEPKIKSDFIAEGSDVYCEEEYEILLGYVNRDAIDELYSSARENDSGYAMVGKKVILIGRSSSALNSSYTVFLSDILKDADEKFVLMSDGDQKLVQAKYTYDQMKINGVNVNEYKIIYPALSSLKEKDLALSLQAYVKEKTGYTLACESDNFAPSAHEIQIGETNRITDALLAAREESGFEDGQHCVCPTADGVWLSGNTTQALMAAVNKFYEMFEVKKSMATLNLSKAVSFETKTVFLSALTYNVYHKFTSARNPDHVLDSIEAQNPDIFGCNEANTEWMTRLTSRFDSSYTCVKGKNSKSGDTGDFCPIFFKTEKFELVESGTKWLSDTPDTVSKYDESHTQRIITYVVLKDKDTSVRFMYVQAHLENNESGYDSTTARKKQSEVLKSFTDAYSLPIIIGGDFNTTKISDLSPLLTLSRFANSSDIASDKKVSGTWVGSSFDAITGGVLDYFFVTKDTVEVRKYEAVDNKTNGKYPSDHIPVRIDAVIYQ